MSFHRLLPACAAILAASFSTVAIAGCDTCGFAMPAPVVYAQPVMAPVYAAPVPVYPEPAPVYGPAGCGGCGGSVAITYAPAAASPPVAPAPLFVDGWDTGGCNWRGLFGGGCGGCFCGGPAAYMPPIAPSPLYVVNQGPEYSGPGIMIPYQTYAPAAAFAPAVNYPYIGARYRGAYYPHYRYRGARVAYRAVVHPPRAYWRYRH